MPRGRPRGKRKQKKRPRKSVAYRTSRCPSYWDRPYEEGENWHQREPKECWVWAKKAYYEGKTRKEICEKTGYKPHCLESYIYGSSPYTKKNSILKGKGWYYERYKENIEAVVQDKREVIEDLVFKGLGLTRSGFERMQQMVDSGAPLTADDISKLVSATQKLHTMGKLESGEATQNIGVQVSVTLDAIEKMRTDLIEADLPFLRVDTIELDNIEHKGKLGDKD